MDVGEVEKLYDVKVKSVDEVKSILIEQKEMIFYMSTEKDENQEKIIKEKITGIGIFNSKSNEAYYINLKNNDEIQGFKEIFEDKEISKIGIDLGRIYILLKQEGINLKGIKFDCSIAAYILNPTNNKLKIEDLVEQFLEIDVNEVLGKNSSQKQEQINLFDQLSNQEQ